MFTALQPRRSECEPMLLSFSVALAMLADAPAASPAPGISQVSATASGSVAGPAADTVRPDPAAANSAGANVPAPATAGTTAANACPQPSPDSRQIVICAERPDGYRLNPDIMEAKREARSAGRPVRPGGTIRPDCATVGPQPCVNAGINLLGAAATLAQMGQRAAKGQEVGSMFQTEPQPDEYHLYLMAKARREEAEKEKAALAWKKAHPAVPASTVVTSSTVAVQPAPTVGPSPQ